MINLSIPNKHASLALTAVLLVTSVTAGIYSGIGLQPTGGYTVSAGLAWFYVLWYWIDEDCRRLELNRPLDMGLFIFFCFPAVYAYHFVKTRGWGRGLLMLAGLGGMFAGWYMLTFAIALIIAFMRIMTNMLMVPGA